MGRKLFACSIHNAMRRKCPDGCFFRSIFPGNNLNAYKDAVKIYGGPRRLLRLLMHRFLGTPFKQYQMAISMIYDGHVRREVDPVHGCAGVLVGLIKRNIEVDRELKQIESLLAFFRYCAQNDVRLPPPAAAQPEPAAAGGDEQEIEDARTLFEQSLASVRDLMIQLELSKTKVAKRENDYENLFSTSTLVPNPSSDSFRMKEVGEGIATESPPLFQNMLNELNNSQQEIREMKSTMELFKCAFGKDADVGGSSSAVGSSSVAAVGGELGVPSTGNADLANVENFLLGTVVAAAAGGELGALSLPLGQDDEEEQRKGKKPKIA